MREHKTIAAELFLRRYNCSQAVFAAYCDLTGLDGETALRVSSAFGGGVGRLREMCGAVSGMMMAVGMLYGYNDAEAKAAKAELYSRVQELAGRFRAENGSYLCRDLLGLGDRGASDPSKPSERNAAFYKKRPCLELVKDAAGILDAYLAENPPRNQHAE